VVLAVVDVLIKLGVLAPLKLAPGAPTKVPVPLVPITSDGGCVGAGALVAFDADGAFELPAPPVDDAGAAAAADAAPALEGGPTLSMGGAADWLAAGFAGTDADWVTHGADPAPDAAGFSTTTTGTGELEMGGDAVAERGCCLSASTSIAMGGPARGALNGAALTRVEGGAEFVALAAAPMFTSTVGGTRDDGGDTRAELSR